MFAVIQLSGRQHRVEKDQVFLADLTGSKGGAEFDCKEVLIVGEAAEVKVGKPFVQGAQVRLKVVEDVRGTKIHGFRYKKRKGTKKTWGHRQDLQRIQVVSIKG